MQLLNISIYNKSWFSTDPELHWMNVIIFVCKDLQMKLQTVLSYSKTYDFYNSF